MPALRRLLVAVVLAVVVVIAPLQCVSATQRDALLSIYTATNGASWTTNTNWNTAAHECNWHGVTCNGLNVVRFLDLESNGLTGSLPNDAWSSLPQLAQLILGNNAGLGGTVPAGIGTLSSLELLEVHGNSHTGPIPETFGGLTSLQNMLLQSNSLSGTLPATLGSCTSLQRLRAFSNQLVGPIPGELSGATNLAELRLNNNQLNGTIPASILLSKLAILSVSGNAITGSIPEELSNTQLATLDLSDNQLTGSLPSSLAQGSLATTLTSFNAENNQLGGTLPPSLGSLTNLVTLELGSNSLTGSIPSELWALTKLETLDLTSNQINGSLPDVAGLPAVTKLLLSNNLLSGTIPGSIVSMASLASLQLNANSALSGSIPSNLGQIATLEQLYAQDTSLSGSLPDLSNTQLSVLILEGTQLTGVLPAYMASMPTLQAINVKNTLFSGNVDEAFASSTLNTLNTLQSLLSYPWPASVLTWCGGAGVTCSYDSVQAAVDASDAAALAELDAALGQRAWNVTQRALDGDSDPCINAWPGVSCAVRSGQITGIDLEALGVSPALTGTVPEAVTAMSALAEANVGSSVMWPSPVTLSTTHGASTSHLVTDVTLQLPTRNALFTRVTYWVEDADTGSQLVPPASADVSAGLLGSTVTATIDLSALAGTARTNVKLLCDVVPWSESTATAMMQAVQTAELAWAVDQQPPDATIVRGPGSGQLVNTRSYEYEFGCSETGCTFQYTLDGSTWADVGDADSTDSGSSSADVCATTLLATPYRVTANASAWFTLQTAAPATALQYKLLLPGAQSATWQAVPANITAPVAADAPVGAWAVAFELATATAGEYTATFRCLDSDGRATRQPIGHMWRVDPSMPPDPPLLACTMAAKPEVVSSVAYGSFRFDATHDAAWYSYQLDVDASAPAQPWLPSGSSLVVGPLSAGDHTITVRCTSAAMYGDTVSLGTWAWSYEPSGPTTAVVEVPSDGSHTLGVRATDAASNVGAMTATRTWSVDTAPPHGSAFLPWWEPPPGAAAALVPATSERVVVVNASAVEADGTPCTACTYRCALEAVGATQQLAPHSIENCTVAQQGLGDGAGGGANASLAIALPIDALYTLVVTAVDEAGNLDEMPPVLTWLADVTAPNTTMAIVDIHAKAPPSWAALQQALYLNASQLQLVVGCSDGAAKCTFSTQMRSGSGGALAAWPSLEVEDAVIEVEASWVQATAQLQVAGRGMNTTHAMMGRRARMYDLPDGEYGFTVAASDAAANEDELAPLVATLVVDTQAPMIATTAAPTARWNATQCAFVWAAQDGSEELLGFHVVITTANSMPSGVDGTTGYTWAGSAGVQLTGLQEGVYHVAAWGQDLAGNAAPLLNVTTTLTVDLTPPAPQVVYTVPAYTNATSGTIAAACPTEWHGCSFEVISSAHSMCGGGCVTAPLPQPRSAVHTTADYEVVALGASLVATEEEAYSYVANSSTVEVVPATVYSYSMEQDGLFALALRATDMAGNVFGEAFVHRWIVDTTPPRSNTTLIGTALGGPVSARVEASVPLSCDETTAPCSYSVRVDGVTAAAVAGNAGLVSMHYVVDAVVSIAGLLDGVHELAVAATDAAGNTETPVTVTWSVDTVQPTVAVTEAPPAHSPDDQASFVVACHDHSSCVVEYRYLGAVASDCVVPATGASGDAPWVQGQYNASATLLLRGQSGTALLPATSWSVREMAYSVTIPAGMEDGKHSIQFRARDAAGNEVAEAQVFSWVVDTKPPASPTLLETPKQQTKELSALFKFKLENEGAGLDPRTYLYEYSLRRDGVLQGEQEWVVITEDLGADPRQVTLSDLQDGTYSFKLRAHDLAGNVGTSTSYLWTISVTPPDTFIDDGPPQSPVQSAVAWATFTLRATKQSPGGGGDSSSGGGGVVVGNGTQLSIQVRINGADWTPVPECTNLPPNTACNYTVTGLERGTYVLDAQAVDAVGNVDTSHAQRPWTVGGCTKDQFARVGARGELACMSCPDGADCGRTDEDNVTEATMAALPGHWTTGSALHNYYTCVQPKACLGGNSTAKSRCAAGHFGLLCSLCAENHFMQFDQCTPCPETQSETYLVMAAILGCVLVAGGMFFALRNVLPMLTIKIIVSTGQVLAAASSSFSVPWPAAFATILDSMKIFMLDLLTMLRTSCAAPQTFYRSYTITVVGFKGVALAILVATVVQAARRRRVSVCTALRRLQWFEVFKAESVYLLLCYPAISVLLMRVFRCIDIDGTPWLLADTRLQCGTGTWYIYAVWSGIMLVVYTFGMPAFSLLLLYRSRNKLGEVKQLARFGHLYQAAGTHAYWGELSEMGRKLALTSFSIFFDAGSALQLVYAILISAVAWVEHGTHKPFIGDKVAYHMQHASLGVTLYMFCCGLLFKQGDSLDTDSFAFQAITLGLVGFVGAFYIAAVVVLVVQTWLNCRKRRRAQALQALKLRGAANADDEEPATVAEAAKLANNADLLPWVVNKQRGHGGMSNGRGKAGVRSGRRGGRHGGRRGAGRVVHKPRRQHEGRAADRRALRGHGGGGGAGGHGVVEHKERDNDKSPLQFAANPLVSQQQVEGGVKPFRLDAQQL